MPGPAATIGSMHTCPMCSGTVPHVGGPITGPGASSVLIGGKPASVIGDLCTCIGPPDTIAQGCSTVLIEGKPAVTVGDMTAHGGAITIGETTVLIGTGTSVPTAIMPIAEIPFPRISIANRLLGNTREAQANQQQLREAKQKEIIVTNLQWKKDSTIISETVVGAEVEIHAEITGADATEGSFVPLIIYEKDEQGTDDYVSSVIGIIENNRINAPWTTINTPDRDDTKSAQELQEQGYTLPEYIVKYGNPDGETVESNLLIIKDQLELKVMNSQTEEALANANYTIALPNGDMIEGQLDADGYAIVEECSASRNYPIVFSVDGTIITTAKY